ncbi:MAG TPA: Gfo/Idh/MocA family oxidoreductase [Planctomycetota bacterium]|nr:Gfo/Idh/MocA family oxidoreductase [Planctomycetota bacterium]
MGAAASDTIRIGLIGCGGRGTGAAMNAMNADPGVRLVALCDVSAEAIRIRRAGLKQQKPDQVTVDDAHCFVGLDGFRKLIECVDVVLIAVASKFHPLYIKTAVEAGKHVFCEKPHAIDPPGVRDLIAACELARQKKLSVASGFHSRYEPGYQATIQRIRDGAIGDIVAIEEHLLRGPYAPYRRTPGLSEVHHQFANWASFAWLSGDDLLQGLVHNLDRDNWLMGDKPPVKCHGLGGRSSAPDDCRGSLFDHHSVVYEYPGGVRLRAFCRTQAGCHNQTSSIVLGTKGRCDLLRWRIEGETNWQYRRPDGPRVSPYDAEHQALFKAIRSGEPLNEGSIMLHGTLAAIMGQLSCYTGKEVTWDQALKSNFTLGPKAEQCSFEMEPPVKPDARDIYPVPIPGVTKLI